MDPGEKTEELRRARRTAALIGVTIIVSLVIYLVIVEVIRSTLGPFTGFARIQNGLSVRYLFYGAAVIGVIAARFLQQVLLRAAPNDDEKTTIHKLSRTAIVTLTLSELPAVLGLVLFLLSGLNRDFYVLLFVSLFLVFMYFPRLSSWKDWLARRK